MPSQHHEALYAHPMTAVFAALARVLGKHRWAVTLGLGEEQPLPKVGCRYARQRRSVLRRGRVLEVIRPVAITLHESLHDPPCRVRLQLRWRIHPLEAGSLLRLSLRYQLNGAAALRERHWNGRLNAHCARTLAFVGAELERSAARSAADCRGPPARET